MNSELENLLEIYTHTQKEEEERKEREQKISFIIAIAKIQEYFVIFNTDITNLN
jgi:hypothetical protein